MNFGSIGFAELIFAILLWALPLVLVVWIIRMVMGVSTSLRDIANRLASLERAVRDNDGTTGPGAR